MNTLTILIIDDEEIDRWHYQRLLKDNPDFNCEFIESDNAKQALTMCQEQHIDCILLDYRLPDMDGIAFVKALKVNSNKLPPIIMITGQGSESIAVTAMKEGISDYIIKSQQTKYSLVKTITSVIEKSKLKIKIEHQEQLLKQQAYYDHVTGLMNRHYFYETAAAVISGAKRHHTPLALLYLDLDNFKTINDLLGHSSGDKLLRECAKRLSALLRKEDLLARFGGDEFVIILVGLTDQGDSYLVAEKIIAALRKPFMLNSEPAHIGVSIGIAHLDEDNDSLIALLKNADVALYKAKTKGRSTYHVFSKDLKSAYEKRIFIEQALHTALEKESFFLVYQPKFELKTKKIIGMEVLLRWKHPELGIIMPDYFIPIAEKSGLIIQIGQWVLETACKQFVHWCSDHNINKIPINIAINLSPQQLSHAHFFNIINNILKHTKINPSLLELEITESSLMHEAENDGVLNRLRERSIQLTIDDFGRGYSSLSRLRELPISSLKIDRPFVQNIHKSAKDAAIVKSIINIAKELDITVVAEGIETESQLNFLIEHGCLYGQGFIISKPLKAEEMTQFLSSL